MKCSYHGSRFEFNIKTATIVCRAHTALAEEGKTASAQEGPKRAPSPTAPGGLTSQAAIALDRCRSASAVWVMPKWGKMLAGLLLAPVCAGGVAALFRVLRQTAQADTFWVAAMGGAACWWVIYLMLPKPMRLYVLGHELTHALWVLLFGGKVHKFKVTPQGGHVVIDKVNFLIALAPYFFPLYALLVIAVYVAGDFVWGWSSQRVWFHFLLGAAYAFHLTLTWHILQTRQSDITEQGYVFSAAVILLGNLMVLMVGIPLLVGQPSLGSALQGWFEATRDLLRLMVHAWR